VYAVVRTGGKQYRVEEGRSIKVDRLPGDPGDTVELGDVLLMGEGEAVTLGAPTIDGARVIGTIAEQGRAPKIVVFRYKAKTRSRKKTGHRQQFTRLVVSDILAAGEAPKPKSERKAPAATAVEEPVEAAAPPVATDKPKRSRRKAEPAPVAAPEAVDEAPADGTTQPPADDTTEPPADATPAQKPKRSRKKTE
jgi:large subunit ribosomal protein L21